METGAIILFSIFVLAILVVLVTLVIASRGAWRRRVAAIENAITVALKRYSLEMLEYRHKANAAEIAGMVMGGLAVGGVAGAVGGAVVAKYASKSSFTGDTEIVARDREGQTHLLVVQVSCPRNAFANYAKSICLEWKTPLKLVLSSGQKDAMAAQLDNLTHVPRQAKDADAPVDLGAPSSQVPQ